jgi:hypothetical protein
MEALAKPFEQGRVGRVSHRVTPWIEPSGQIKAYRGTKPACLLDRQAWGKPALDATGLRGRKPRESGNIREAQIPIEPV